MLTPEELKIVKAFISKFGYWWLQYWLFIAVFAIGFAIPIYSFSALVVIGIIWYALRLIEKGSQ